MKKETTEKTNCPECQFENGEHSFECSFYEEQKWRKILNSGRKMYQMGRKESVKEIIGKIDKVYEKEKGIHHWLDLREELLKLGKVRRE